MSGLPRGWVEARLGEICDFNPKHDPEVDRATTVSFIPMPAVDDETGAITDRSAIRPLSEVWKGYTHFADADVIFAKITPCMENGKIAVARDLENGMACGSTEFHVLRSKGAVEPDFVWRFLRQRSYRQVAERSMTGAVGQRRVPKPFLEGTVLPLPPLAEQKRIVAKLDALNAKSARARTELARIETLVSRYKQAVLGKAFSGELTQEWRRGLLQVDAWRTSLVGSECEIRLGKMLDKAKNKGEPTLYLRNINVRWGSFDLSDILSMNMTSDERAKLDIRDGDVLLCEGGEPGRCAVWSLGPTDISFQKALMRVRPRLGLTSHFFFFFMRWAAVENLLTQHLTGTTIKHLPQAALSRVRTRSCFIARI